MKMIWRALMTMRTCSKLKVKKTLDSTALTLLKVVLLNAQHALNIVAAVAAHN